MRNFFLWLTLSGVVIALDQLSKFWVLLKLDFGRSIEVTSFFNLVLVYNAGAAFSFLANAGGWQRWFFVVLALVISVWLVIMIRQHAKERLLPLAAALILGGALGNVVDRILYGAVIDFLDVHVGLHHWPVFNLADSAITLGVVLMLWQQFFGQQMPSKVEASK